LLKNQTAGDPQSARKWKRKSLQQLSQELKPQHPVAPHTVGRVLREQKYSLHVNYKELDGRASPDRNAQFVQIEAQIQQFLERGWPIISVDTKKRELIGNFRNPGRVWCRKPPRVNVYDFRSLAKGIAIPYGIYDLTRNAGYVFVGTTADTSEFAVDAIQWWWTTYGRQHYPQASALLILADGGGSNGYRTRLWKYSLQYVLVNRSGLDVTVTHFPTGASKWNPADHRLFSAISCNWAGEALTSYPKMLHLIDATTTEQGLIVTANLTQQTYATKIKISDKQMATLKIEKHTTLPQWNYTIKPLTENR
jgi:Rhodopirellula transposase DDE domain